jgi:hypothetical protein
MPKKNGRRKFIPLATPGAEQPGATQQPAPLSQPVQSTRPKPVRVRPMFTHRRNGRSR